MKKIRWGILGLGRMAEKFILDFHRAKGGQITALGSRLQEKAEIIRDKLKLPDARAYGSYADVCRDGAVDMVYVATPHALHMENTLMALEAGKGVLCEKPIAVNSRQLQQMIRAAAHNKLFLMEAMWTAFLPVILEVKKALAAGEIGEVKRITADFSINLPWNPQDRVFNPDLAGGALLDIGIYPLFITQYLLNGNPEAIEAVAYKGETGVDEHAAVILKYPGGQIAQLSFATRFTTPSLARITGTGGAIHIPKFWRADSAEVIRENMPSRKIAAPPHSYHYQVDEVHRCLELGLIESPVMPLKVSAGILKTMDMIRKKIGLVYPFEG